jgi:hypothetical protein
MGSPAPSGRYLGDVAFWRKDDNDFGAVTCRPTFQCFAAMGVRARVVALPVGQRLPPGKLRDRLRNVRKLSWSR